MKIDGIGGPKWKLANPGILGKTAIKLKHTNTHTTPVSWPFVRDYPGEPVPER